MLAQRVGQARSFFSENTKVLRNIRGTSHATQTQAPLTCLLEIKSCSSRKFQIKKKYCFFLGGCTAGNDEEKSLMFVQLKSFDWILPLTLPLYRGIIYFILYTEGIIQKTGNKLFLFCSRQQLFFLPFPVFDNSMKWRNTIFILERL